MNDEYKRQLFKFAFITQLQNFGMTLEEIEELVDKSLSSDLQVKTAMERAELLQQGMEKQGIYDLVERTINAIGSLAGTGLPFIGGRLLDLAQIAGLAALTAPIVGSYYLGKAVGDTRGSSIPSRVEEYKTNQLAQLYREAAHELEQLQKLRKKQKEEGKDKYFRV